MLFAELRCVVACFALVFAVVAGAALTSRSAAHVKIMDF